MSWKLLPTNFTDAIWAGLKKYIQVDNPDGTVSFQDVTAYSQKEKSFFGAAEANRMNEAMNTIMAALENGTDLYEIFQNYFEEQKKLFEAEGDATLDSIKVDCAEDVEQFKSEQEVIFQKWFEAMKYMLSEDVAAKLASDMVALEGRMDAAETAVQELDDNVVKSFNGRKGEIESQAGDYTAADVGANEAGSADAVQQNLTSHTSSRSNPHAVTASQVGLGNVPDVSTNNQTPTYTAASTLTALTSGEKLSVAFGKLR